MHNANFVVLSSKRFSVLFSSTWMLVCGPFTGCDKGSDGTTGEACSLRAGDLAISEIMIDPSVDCSGYDTNESACEAASGCSWRSGYCNWADMCDPFDDDETACVGTGTCSFSPGHCARQDACSDAVCEPYDDETTCAAASGCRGAARLARWRRRPEPCDETICLADPDGTLPVDAVRLQRERHRSRMVRGLQHHRGCQGPQPHGDRAPLARRVHR